MTGLSGAEAEQTAAQFLSQQGLTLLCRNFRVKGGEIDLVMREGKTLVFVEVRARRSGAFGGAAESIDSHKRARICHAAQHYLQALKRTPLCRFDVVAFDGSLDKPQWVQDAFRSTD